MDYIEIEVIENNEIISTYRYNDKVITLSKNETEKIFDLLNKNKFRPKKINVDGKNILRYYDVGKYIDEKIIAERKNILKKVKRTNKYAPAVATVSSILALSLILSSCVSSSKQNQPVTEREIPPLVIIEPEPLKTVEPIIADSYFDFEYEDRSGTEKARSVKENYYGAIERYADMYGLPTNLMISIATQEKAKHSEEISSGGGFGLFQIQAEGNWNWVGKDITAYNHDSSKYETMTICLNEDGCLDKNMLGDLYYNIKVACMIMAYDLELCNYDIILALQTYNSGTSTINLKNTYGEDWVNHRQNLAGDPNYIEHVLSYLPSEDNVLTFMDTSSNLHTVQINNVYNSLTKS